MCSARSSASTKPVHAAYLRHSRMPDHGDIGCVGESHRRALRAVKANGSEVHFVNIEVKCRANLVGGAKCNAGGQRPAAGGQASGAMLWSVAHQKCHHFVCLSKVKYSPESKNAQPSIVQRAGAKGWRLNRAEGESSVLCMFV